MNSILIKNALVYDGLGNSPTKSDVLVENDIIKLIKPWGEIPQADKVINAKGKVLCPGFVDIHRHCDAKPFNNPNFGNVELSQGITSVVIGNCGIGLVPVPENYREVYDFNEAVIGSVDDSLPKNFSDYIDGLKKLKLPVNFGACIGFGAVQITVKGFTDRSFSEDEKKQATEIIEKALLDGAFGVSLGIMYAPECYNKAEDYIEILKPLSKYKMLISAHIRGEGDSLISSVKEVITIAKAVNCPLEISHFKSCGIKNWRKDIFVAINEIEKARADGYDISCDFYPYEGGSTSLTTMLAPSFINGDMTKTLKYLGTKLGVEAFRKSSKIEHENWDNFCISVGWDRLVISGVSLDEFKPMIGMSVQKAAEEFGYEDSVVLASDLMHKENGKTAIIVMSMCQDDIDEIAKLPYSNVISDSIYADTDSPHPRMYGAFPKIIREYVIKRKVLSFENAIEKMTSKPAKRMKIEKRGEITENYYADILIFDPNKFQDHATFENPTLKTTGLDYVILNGEIVLENDKIIKNSFNGNLIMP